MPEPLLGEIRMFASNFAPRGWALCQGQLLPVAQNQGLFSLLGTTYGGDGRTTFALPDLRGRIPIHQGTGPGLTPRLLGSRTGTQTVVLTTDQLASHTHDLMANTAAANVSSPQGRVLAAGGPVVGNVYADAAPDTDMASTAITDTGGSYAHTNMMPSLCVSFIIALVGTYPSRN